MEHLDELLRDCRTAEESFKRVLLRELENYFNFFTTDRSSYIWSPGVHAVYVQELNKLYNEVTIGWMTRISDRTAMYRLVFDVDRASACGTIMAHTCKPMITKACVDEMDSYVCKLNSFDVVYQSVVCLRFCILAYFQTYQQKKHDPELMDRKAAHFLKSAMNVLQPTVLKPMYDPEFYDEGMARLSSK